MCTVSSGGSSLRDFVELWVGWVGYNWEWGCLGIPLFVLLPGRGAPLEYCVCQQPSPVQL